MMRSVMRTGFMLAATLVMLAPAAMAQVPSPGTSSPSGGPPPGGPPQGLLPPGGPPASGQIEPERPFGPTTEQLTEAQKLVAALPPASPGGMMPSPPLGPDTPLPNKDPRDFQGTWFHNQNLLFRNERDMYGNPLPYNMAGAKIMVRRVHSLQPGGAPFINASSMCRPPGQQWQHDLNMPFQIFQSKNWIEILFEEYHGRWHIVLDPAAAPPPAQKNYMGYSVGHWEGNTLVVETKDFRQALWLDVDGTPMSANGKLIHRIRKAYSAEREPFLEVITTVDDPTYYTKPWSIVRTWGWQPAFAMMKEYDCEEQIGDPTANPDNGLVPEPRD